MSSLLRLRHAVLLALIVALVLPSAASGYAGQTATMVTITGPTGTVQCGVSYEYQATVFDAAGNRVPGHQVLWTIVSAPVGANDLVTYSTTTDANGIARTRAFFAGSAGPRTLRATSDNAFAQIVVEPQGCRSAVLPIPVSVGSCASALGITTSGPFDQATEVQRAGGYITFRLSFGPEFANKPVIITRASRGVPFTGWGSFFGATIRIADANGDAYYWFRSRTPAWISVRGLIIPSDGDGAAISRACQGRFI